MDKALENKARRAARRFGLILRRSRTRDPNAPGHGCYALFDARLGSPVFGVKRGCYMANLQDVFEYLNKARKATGYVVEGRRNDVWMTRPYSYEKDQAEEWAEDLRKLYVADCGGSGYFEAVRVRPFHDRIRMVESSADPQPQALAQADK